MIEPLPRIDWSSADRSTEELKARLKPEPPSIAGAGLGQNGDLIDNLTPDGSAGGGLAGFQEADAILFKDGLLITGTIAAKNLAEL